MLTNKNLLISLALLLFSTSSIAESASSINGFFNQDIFGLQTPDQRQWSHRVPWKIPTDTTTALNTPDLYAWQLFVSLNWPANTDNCRPNKFKTLGDNGLTTWQTWQTREELFLPLAEKPNSWRVNCSAGHVIPLPEGDTSAFADEGVYLNKKAYNFIRRNKLYSLNEQERLAAAGVRDIDFPIGSKEVKAHWTKIIEADKPRYHWAEVERDGVIVTYGLTGLHIISKDFPTWFWSTFEHVDNETRWENTYPSAFRGWVVPSVDSIACPPDNLSCNDIPLGFGLEGTKWENYRLRGTQIDWVDNRGKPTVVANSQIEGFMDQKTVSCLTCHALALKGATGPSRPIPLLKDTVNEDNYPHGYVGPVETQLLLDENGNEVSYLGLDYVWALRNAQREE